MLPLLTTNADAMQEPAPVTDNDAKDIALLTRIPLEHLSAESMEKEEKQRHYMCVRLVRDKLAARRRRRSEVLLQQLTLASKYKKRPDATSFDKMESNEEEIVKLEVELATLQERECRRHREMMETQKTRLCAVTIIGMNPIIRTSESLESIGSGGTDWSYSTPRNNEHTLTTVVASDVAQTSGDESVCMECNLIPMNHMCFLKYTVVCICACCCSANRGLENITWCKTCFDTETPTGQQIATEITITSSSWKDVADCNGGGDSGQENSSIFVFLFTCTRYQSISQLTRIGSTS